MYYPLEQLQKTLAKLQHDNANVADAYEINLELLQNKELNLHFSKVKSSFNKEMPSVHFLAHLMNAKYNGKNLSQD